MSEGMVDPAERGELVAMAVESGASDEIRCAIDEQPCTRFPCSAGSSRVASA
jgi:hypothetical protein